MLRAIWYEYYGTANFYINSRDIPPGHFDVEHPQLISVDYTARFTKDNISSECAPFTLLVTHINNDSNALDHHPIDAYNDVATVTWWLSINDTNAADGLHVTDCPTGPGP